MNVTVSVRWNEMEMKGEELEREWKREEEEEIEKLRK